MKLKTSEPIDIELESMQGDTSVTVDGIDYAVIEHVEPKDMSDAQKAYLVKWVEETYYDDDYKSSAHTPAYLKADQFFKDVTASFLGKVKARYTVKAGWSYQVEPLYISLVEKSYSKVFNIDTMQKIRNVWLDVKSEDGEGSAAPQITDHKSSGLITRADEMKGNKREVILTLSVPKGYGAKYTAAIKKVLPEFQVEKLDKWRSPAVVLKK
jgi:hypothetical protein